MFFIIITAIIIIYCTIYYIKNKRKFYLGEQFAGPKAAPLFGYNLRMLNKKSDNFMRSMDRSVKRYGEFFRVWHGHKLFFWVTDPNVIEIILSNSIKHLAKNSEYDFMVPWLGYGLLLSSGKKWHGRRKIITPAFHFKILENFISIFDRQSTILVNQLIKHRDGNVFNVEPFITLFTLDIVCETAMGTTINAQTNAQSEYVKAVSTISKIVAERFVKIWQKNDLLFKIFARKQKQKQDEAIKILHNFTVGIIKQRRKELIDKIQVEKADTHCKSEFIKSRKEALLDILLKSTIDGKPLSDADIREEVDTFMFEGHDTTTASICFTLSLLSRHKEIQDKLFVEIKTVLGTEKDRSISYRELQELKYLEYVIKESLRLYPSVPMFGRQIEEDTVIDNDKIIPAGSSFGIPVFAMHRNAKYFPQPNDFIPERFSTNHEYSIEDLNPFTYIPFSAGSRNCIGQKFAMFEMKSTISKILRHFEVLPRGEEPIPTIALVIRSKNGFQIGLKERIY